MNTQKLTPWYPGTVKPARVGVYLRNYHDPDSRDYCLWDGEVWSICYPSAKSAAANGREWPSPGQSLPWRGIAK